MIQRVVVLIEKSRAWGRGLISGIAKYSCLNGPWNFLKKPVFFLAGSNRGFLKDIIKFNPDGIIMREVPDTEEIIEMGKPVVISPHKHRRFDGALNILENCEATGTMAAEHLLSKGLRNFAFCGYDDMFWSRDRGEGFCRRISQKGLEVSVYKQPKRKTDRIWENEQPILKQWLLSLPKPVGLMCCIDERSEQVIEICKVEGIHVPEEVAVIGVDNDEMICELSFPPLTSIAFDSEGVGYHAARLLDRLMKGEKLDSTEFTVAPAYVVQRQSTEITATEDAGVAEALSYIRKNTGRRLSVDDVVEAVIVPRRTLERRFHMYVGNSIYKEIQNEQIARIERMLIETNMSISEIAYAMGFSNPNELTRAFCKHRDMTPTAYRKKHKLYVVRKNDKE